LWLPEVIMNIAVFIPVGLALGLAFRKAKGWQAAMAGMGVSVGIELLQWLFRKGFADVDDVMHNVLGCALGCWGWWIFRRGVKGERVELIIDN
jgi:glycopeptide antibiotics resistance protein